MPNYHTVNAFLTVRNADALIVAYQQVLNAKLLSRDPVTGTVQRAELQVGDSIIAITEALPQGNYLMSISDDVTALRQTILDAGEGWTVTEPIPHGDFLVIHATDPAGVTWIFQQHLACPPAETEEIQQKSDPA